MTGVESPIAILVLRLLLGLGLVTACLLIAKYIFSVLLGRRLSIPEGLVALLAIHELLVLPFLLLHLSLRVYTVVLIVTLATLAFAAAKRSPARPRLPLKRLAPDLLVTLLLAAALVGLGLAYQRPDADDFYYLGLASDNVAYDQINGRDPSTGAPSYQLAPFYPLQGYEVLISVIALLSGLPVAIVAHIIFFAVVVTLSLMAFRRLLIASGLSPPYVALGMPVFAALVLFSGSSVYMMGNFILSRAWQGKVVMVAILMPLLVAYLISLHGKRLSRRDIIWLTAIAVASVSVNPVSIYLFPPFIAVFRLLNWRAGWRQFVLDMAVLLPPYVVAAATIKLLTVQTHFEAFALKQGWLGQVGIGTWWQIAVAYFGGAGALLLFLVTYGVCLILARKPAQRIPLYTIGIIALTLSNPLLAGPVAHYLTSPFTYWRLFWLLMAEYVIVLAFVLLFQAAARFRGTPKLLTIALATGFLALTLAGRAYLFTAKNGFTLTQNRYKLPDPLVQEAAAIPPKSLVLAPVTRSTYLRILRPDLQSAFSRDNYMQYLLRDDPARLADLTQMANVVEGAKAPDAHFDALLHRFSVRAVMVDAGFPALTTYMSSRYHAASFASGTVFIINR